MSGAYDEARRAAYAARYGELTDTYTWNLVADAVLAAVAPLIAAGERERIAQLAADHDVRYATERSGLGMPMQWGSFADLICQQP